MNANNIRIAIFVIILLVVVVFGAAHALTFLGAETPNAAANYAELFVE